MEICKICFINSDQDWTNVLSEIAKEHQFEIVTDFALADVLVLDRNSIQIPNDKILISLGESPQWLRTSRLIPLSLPLNRPALVRAFQKAKCMFSPQKSLDQGHWYREGIFLQLDDHLAWHHDSKIDLTPTEFSILECLVRSQGMRQTRDQILKTAIEQNVCDQTLDTHLFNIKKKIPAMSQWIHNLRGEGICLNPDVS